ncbi:LexA/Signal peptidase [Panus rudis PR-1116 ss-1]|nr:LexA/Signal peptidase [Panus rudis PR-1116 ss-1]
MSFLRSFSTFRAKLFSKPIVRRTASALVWLPIGIVFTEYGYNIKVVSGRSMQPTLNPDDSISKDIVVFDRYSVQLLRQYKRGDVVALKSPYDSKQLLVKRIIALPGDKVKTLPPYPDAEVTIPEGHAWVEGDEPFKSEDSNYFGPVALGLIDSKLVWILWPWARIGPLARPTNLDRKKMTGPAWRKHLAVLEREERRKARVTIASSGAS